MSNVRPCARHAAAVMLTAALCLASAALADNTMQTIVVEAGVMAKTVVGQTTIGAPVEEVTLSHRVSYADLDLATHKGAVELKRRVRETARIACEQLDKLYPVEEKQAPECIDEAVERAARQVDQAIAAAERNAKEQ